MWRKGWNMNKEERQKNGKMPKTFQKKLILYNMLVIICIASAVSFYNYRSYCQDVIISETNNSANRVRTLSERLQVAYDEMVNIVLNCAERKSLFFATTLDSPNKPYNTSMAVYASDVLRDFCAISGYSRYINKIVLYHNGLVLQAGNSFGASMDVENIYTERTLNIPSRWRTIRSSPAKAGPRYRSFFRFSGPSSTAHATSRRNPGSF